MRRAGVVLIVFFSLGGCASYRSVSGRIYRPGHDSALLAALRDSGSTSLKCDPSQVRVRRFATGRSHALLVAEGCGQRASYLTDCSSHAEQADGDEEGVCDLVLISKVQLD